MNSSKVQITIQSTQHDIAGEATETTYIGSYRYLAGKHIVTYNEYFEDESAAPSVNKNLVKINEESVQISKKGTVTTKMHFETNKKHSGMYQTPFGDFDMAIHTEQLNVHETEQTITATMIYTLSLNGCQVSHYTVQMKITAIT